MQKYVKLYMDFFGYGEDDFIPSEISGDRTADIHHIRARSQRMDLLNDITNLIALTRKEHDKYGDKKQYIEFLQETHNQFIEKHKQT